MPGSLSVRPRHPGSAPGGAATCYLTQGPPPRCALGDCSSRRSSGNFQRTQLPLDPESGRPVANCRNLPVLRATFLNPQEFQTSVVSSPRQVRPCWAEIHVCSVAVKYVSRPRGVVPSLTCQGDSKRYYQQGNWNQLLIMAESSSPDIATRKVCREDDKHADTQTCCSTCNIDIAGQVLHTHIR
jgi:hypothetical protein